MSELRTGAILSYVNIFLANAVGLFLTPFIIRTLGDSEYGLYTLIGALAAYLAVLDFGFGNAVIRYVSFYRAAGDHVGLSRFLGTTARIYAGIAMCVLACGGIVYWDIAGMFPGLTEGQLGKAKIMLLLVVLNVVITLFDGVFTGVAAAHEKFIVPRSISISRYLARACFVVVVLLLGGGAVGIVVVDTLVNATSMLLIAAYTLGKTGVKFTLSAWDRALARDVGKYAFWVFVLILVSRFQWQSGQLILGRYMDTSAVAIYGVGVMLGTYYGAFATAFSSVFVPRASAMLAEGRSGQELTDFSIRVGRLSFLVLSLILGGFLLYGKQFIFLWVGKQYEPSYWIASIIMLAYTLPLVQSFVNSILESRKKLAFKAIVYIVTIPAGVGIGILLLNFYGMIGVAMGMAIGWGAALVVMNIYYEKILRLDMLRFFAHVFAVALPVFLVALGCGMLIDRAFGLGWLSLCAKLVMFILLFFLLMYQFFMNAEERALLGWILRLVVRKKELNAYDR